jgi:iron complex transport system substrate-binding protein
MIVSDEELELAEQSYSEGKITSDELEEIRHIHDDYPKTIVDSADQEVTIYKPLKRVVIAYWIDAAITLQALKAEDIVVGVTQVIADDEQLFPKLSKLPVVGAIPRVESLDFEAILELKPDAVITGGNHSKWDAIQEEIQSLDPNIVVIRFDYASPETYLDEVKKNGYLFDKDEEADELIDFIDGHLSQIKERVATIPSDERVAVYCEVFNDYQTGDIDYIELAGGIPTFGDISQDTVAVDPEEVIVRNPEVIIHLMGSKYAGKIGWEVDDVTAMREKRDEIISRPGFADVDAVKSGRVYAIASNIVKNSIYPVGICYYAKWFYPEHFEDMDPNAIHQEYLSRFLGIDYDLSKHGAFVYHPEQHPDGR